MAEQYPHSEVLLVNKESDVYLELAAGRGDIGFGSSVVATEAFLKRSEGRAHTVVGAPVRLGGRGGGGGAGGGDGGSVGIAFRKGETVLRDKVNAALKGLKADGSYKQMADRYFDFDISGGG